MLDTRSCMQLIQAYGAQQASRFITQQQEALCVWQATQHDMSFFTLPEKRAIYCLCGIDGSQIYPDKHEGFSEYLINVGAATFTYARPSTFQFYSEPFLFSGMEENIVTPEYVNSQRTAYELRHAVGVSNKGGVDLILFDGALLFWHIENPELQERFLPDYLQSLKWLHEKGTWYAGYISASHSRELIMLLEAAARARGHVGLFDYLVDTDILQQVLKPGMYTQPFKSKAGVIRCYPPELEPRFVYAHMGSEIARIEVPAYLAESSTLSEILAIIIDQQDKGNGYPVALSEAHEQAVIKAPDRELFYHLLRMHYPHKASVSLKLSKKRSAAI